MYQGARLARMYAFIPEVRGQGIGLQVVKRGAGNVLLHLPSASPLVLIALYHMQERPHWRKFVWSLE